jgi:preprotein translocase subunit SecB
MSAEKEWRLSPEKYNKLLSRIELRDIALRDVHASCGVGRFEEKVYLSLKESAEIEDRSTDKVTITISYDLKGKYKRRNAFSVKATYAVTFDLNDELPDEFFEIFRQTSLPLYTYPYFRELANSSISRMGLPPLVMPLRRNLVGPS